MTIREAIEQARRAQEAATGAQMAFPYPAPCEICGASEGQSCDEARHALDSTADMNYGCTQIEFID